jgi:hypothetical protein
MGLSWPGRSPIGPEIDAWVRERGGFAVRPTDMSRSLRITVAVAFLLAVGACASTGTSPISTSPISTTSSARSSGLTVTLTRSGGFAGARDRIVITPEGAWTRTDKAGKQTHGQLTADRTAQLQDLAHQPALVDETAPPSSPTKCSDGYVYAVNAGSVTVSYTDCGNDRPPVAGQMASLISGWTTS